MKSILLAAGFVCVAASALAQPFFVADTPTGYLNLRAGPDVGQKVIARLYSGQTFNFVAERGNWLQVRLTDGKIGWASEKYLYTFTALDGDTLTVLPTPDGYLNLREGPGIKHAIKQRIYPGQFVSLQWREGSWLRVQTVADRTFGWVHSRYIKWGLFCGFRQLIDTVVECSAVERLFLTLKGCLNPQNGFATQLGKNFAHLFGQARKLCSRNTPFQFHFV